MALCSMRRWARCSRGACGCRTARWNVAWPCSPRVWRGIAASAVQASVPFFLTFLAEAHLRRGQVEEGLAVIEEAVQLTETHFVRFWTAEVYRLQGELLLAQAGQACRSARPGDRDRRGVLPAGPRHRTAAGGESVGAAGRHQPQPRVAGAGQIRRRAGAVGRVLRLVQRRVGHGGSANGPRSAGALPPRGLEWFQMTFVAMLLPPRGWSARSRPPAEREPEASHLLTRPLPPRVSASG